MEGNITETLLLYLLKTIVQSGHGKLSKYLKIL